MSQTEIISEHPCEASPETEACLDMIECDDVARAQRKSALTISPSPSSSSISSLSDSVDESVDPNIQAPPPSAPCTLTPMCGVLLKWTNYIHGWQHRYIVLEDGFLSYYKSEHEKSVGCRGAITIVKANIKLHEIDECRFDFSVADCAWYLRAPSVEECRRWVTAIQEHKAYYQSIKQHQADSSSTASSMVNGQTSTTALINAAPYLYGGNGDNADILRRHESALSISSITSCRSYKEQLNEMDTFRSILFQQIKTLQHYFDSALQSTNMVNEHFKRHRRHQSMNGFNYNLDNNQQDAASATRNNNAPPNTNNSNCDLYKSQQSSTTTSESSQLNAASINTKSSRDHIFIDFKKEAFTFKATTAGILSSLTNCIDLMTAREEQLKKRFEKEQTRRKKVEEHNKRIQAELEETRRALAELQLELQTKQIRQTTTTTTDYEADQQQQHSIIKEEEFYDAIDAALVDRSEQLEEDMRQLKLQTMNLSQPLDVTPPPQCDHPLWPDVERVTMEQLYYARLEVQDTPTNASGGSSSSWELFAEDGQMRLYKRELEIEGLVCDPLKAVHTVTGVTAHEVCHQFFSPDVRFDWENTLDSMKVIENINPNTLVFHQIHKRVWPAAQRDTVFWSHIRKIDKETLLANGHPNSTSKQLPDDVWIVCNNSVQRPDIEPGRCLRMTLVVSMCCELYIDPSITDMSLLTRDHLRCKIIYCSTINPGGWAPASVLRTLYKREYPKFMKRFSQYCIDVYKDKPIML